MCVRTCVLVCLRRYEMCQDSDAHVQGPHTVQSASDYSPPYMLSDGHTHLAKPLRQVDTGESEVKPLLACAGLVRWRQLKPSVLSVKLVDVACLSATRRRLRPPLLATNPTGQSLVHQTHVIHLRHQGHIKAAWSAARTWSSGKPIALSCSTSWRCHSRSRASSLCSSFCLPRAHGLPRASPRLRWAPSTSWSSLLAAQWRWRRLRCCSCPSARTAWTSSTR